MKVLITGSDGFIAKNLRLYLTERSDIELCLFSKKNVANDLFQIVKEVDFIFHLAGTNRPDDDSSYMTGNLELTQTLCEAIKQSKRKVQVVFSSSIRAGQDTGYGKSKYQAEVCLERLAQETECLVCILRLPNVFGKWSRPNYNSVVATFCYNISHDLPIDIHDKDYTLELIYIDDLVRHFSLMLDSSELFLRTKIKPVYEISVGELANKLYEFKESRESGLLPDVGIGLDRALYATYLSFYDTEHFSYTLDVHVDSRGKFTEILKTQRSGQVSYFTAAPGVTRGGHYHHTKNEKFLVIHGEALFRFRHLITNDYYELWVKASDDRIVETVPGWAHDVTNVSKTELIVILWANEIFDKDNPDTYERKLGGI